jgi:transcription elongation factor Elf1
MQSIFTAILDFLMNFKKKPPKPIEKKPEPLVKELEHPPGYKPLYFNCWLCKGETKFACKPLTKEKKFTIECKWCGVENHVTVTPKK